jgi:hypothetical protein
MVDLISLLPSVLLVQLFRRTKRRQQLSPLRETLTQMKRQPMIDAHSHSKKRSPLTFPWWCLFVAYGLCLILVGVSSLLIIARGIEFGDLKTQKWLASIVTGFFSSISLTQPIKVFNF